MGFFSKKAVFLTPDQQREVFVEVAKNAENVQSGFSIRGAIVNALAQSGFGHMALDSSTEKEMTSLIGQACNLPNHSSLDDIESHCKTLNESELKKAIGRASQWT